MTSLIIDLYVYLASLMGHLLVCIVGLLSVCVNAGINVCILTMHVYMVMGSQLDEHLLFWQPTICTTLYVIALYFVWFLRWK